jgi:hypothetical protein
LYPLHLLASTALRAGLSSTLWHRHLGHPGQTVLAKLPFACNKDTSSPLCHACQLGRHTRLPFRVLSSRALSCFDLIHCDLWTSPISSISGFKYYLVILDDHTHYLWAFPIRLKSDTFNTLANFFSYVKTQFGTPVKAIQCDNGHEFDYSSTCRFFSTMVSCCTCRAPTPQPKIGGLSASSGPLTTLCAPCCFRPAFHPHTGLKLWRQPPTSSTSCRPRRCP